MTALQPPIPGVRNASRTPSPHGLAQGSGTGGQLPVTPDRIIRAVAAHFGLQPEHLIRRSNTREIVWPRQIAMWLCRELLGLSLPKIGRLFGRKHHTTVLYAIRMVNEQMRLERRTGSGHSSTADLLANIIEQIGRDAA